MTTLVPTETVPLLSVMSRSFVVIGSHWTAQRALDFMKGARTTHIVVQRIEDNGHEFFYLMLRQDVLSQLQQVTPESTVHFTLDLHEYKSVPATEGSSDAGEAPPVGVVREHGMVVGFVDDRVLPFSAASPARARSFDLDVPEPFRAYPAVNAPKVATAGMSFDLYVGFRPTPDTTLPDSPAIEIAGAQPSDKCLVLLSGDGISFDRDHDLVPLQQNAVVPFQGTLHAGVDVGNVKVLYVFRDQVIGAARREIRADTAAPLDVAVEVKANPCRMSLPEASRGVDITVSVTHRIDGTLEWRFIAAASTSHDVTRRCSTTLPGTSEFAASLMRDLRSQQFKGALARNVLTSTGSKVAGLIPAEFFALLSEVHRAIGRTPTLLWLTDEAFVPWELALLDDPLDPARPPFLGAQTLMGRWLDDEHVMLPPPREVDVKRMSVVASEYGFESKLRKLTEAITERDELVKRWEGLPMEATLPDIHILAGGAKFAGHLVHFAVHGYSDPTANAQSLLLADKREVPASALIGGHRCGELARFAFVFLNACQVGTPGRSLGQAGGFPGEMLRGGSSGFIAPLWDVDDADARGMAEAFYEDVFHNKASVGAAINTRRLAYDGGGTTPLAYLFYGHPALALRRIL